jgi:glycosyltransferase involved in cell wall biosynthesis
MTASPEITVLVGRSVIAERPAISVIIPNYNTAEYISETLDSVLSQSFTSFEVIVINDASPDSDTLKRVIAPYLGRITFIDKSVNEGTSVTRNRAVETARAETIAFLDADDIWHPTFLEELIGFMEKGDFDVAYADAELFGTPRLNGKTLLPNNPAEGPITRELLIGGKCQILPSGTLIRKRVFEAVGGFDPEISRTEDFDLWMRLMFSGARFGYLLKVLFKFRIRPESGSGDSLQRIERCIEIWHTLRGKLPFTETENRVIDRNIELEAAALLRAKGRMYLIQANWGAARTAFSQAKRKAAQLGLPMMHRLKLQMVLVLLALSPKLLLKLLRTARADEIGFMPTGDRP